ncbi:MAG: YdbL family protein [Candidatus Omnitrophica bacterium]|nr:YdbL family protein [Candidatus Omnitrophota bacterium]
MRKCFIIATTIFLSLGCARVNLATKDPIKMDISLRVDVYQHVVEEVKSIEEQIYGEDSGAFLWNILEVKRAYAADTLQEAIQRRKSRADIFARYAAKGYIGENRKGYLELLAKQTPANLHSEIKVIVTSENLDREDVYKHVAQKDKIELPIAEEIFFKDHFKRAPKGYWFEVYNEQTGEYIWQKK